MKTAWNMKSILPISGSFLQVRWWREAAAVYVCKLIVGQLYPDPHAHVIEDETMVEIFRMSFMSLWNDLKGMHMPPEPIEFPE